MNKPIGRQSKDVVYKVYKYFEVRKNDRTSSEYANDINLAKTVSVATGFSVTSVKKIVKEGRCVDAPGSTVSFTSPRKNLCPKKKIEIDSFIEGVIRRKVGQWYTVKKRIPSLKSLNAELKEENVIHCSREYLRQTLHRLGFKFVSCQSKRKLLIERHDIMRLRWYYIIDIKKYRQEGRPIFFLDETHVNQRHVTPKCVHSQTERDAEKHLGKAPRLIIVHSGSRHDFVNNALLIFKSYSTTGDHHGDMNTTNIQKWVDEKLLPNIPLNSVFVLGNAAYLSAQIDRKPTATSVKSKMTEWLDRRGVQYDRLLRKCDLMKIINEQNTEKRYKIDEILKEKGHAVLRIPPCHSDLNPIELVWGEIRGEFARISVDSDLEKKESDLESLFYNYSPAQWSNSDDHVINNEAEYYNSDRVFDEEFDRLVLSLNEDDRDDDDDDEETEEELNSDMEFE